MKIYDLTRTLSSETEVYPGDPAFALSHIMRMPGDMCNLGQMSLCLHTGTHADAPLHFIGNGADIGSLPLAHFAGRAYVAHIVPENGIIRTDAICRALDRLDGEHIFVVYTGHESFAGMPVFESEIGQLLRGAGIITLATDLVSAEPAGIMHRDLLEKGIVIIEALTALGRCRVTGYFCRRLPLK